MMILASGMVSEREHLIGSSKLELFDYLTVYKQMTDV